MGLKKVHQDEEDPFEADGDQAANSKESYLSCSHREKTWKLTL